MSISFLLTFIIIICGISLVFLLFPKQSQNALTKKKAAAPKTPPRKLSSKPTPLQASKTEAEAIREAVQQFASKDPEATAKILKSWIKKQ